MADTDGSPTSPASRDAEATGSSRVAASAPAAPTAPATPVAPTTKRGRAKADRRRVLLDAAARLYAERGYNGVSIEELGAAAGVSGPAVYRHFAGKQAVLAALLVEVSEFLLAGGRAVAAEADDAETALRDLIAFHVDFALANPDVIRVQDRDLPSLASDDRHTVRALQGRYVEEWVRVLALLHPGVAAPLLRVRALAAFGLMNSTPHSARADGRAVASATARPLLERMAWAALTAR